MKRSALASLSVLVLGLSQAVASADTGNTVITTPTAGSPTTASSTSSDKDETSPFSGGAEVNLNLNSGNTNINTYGASAFMDFRVDDVNTRVRASYLQNTTDGVLRSRRIDGSARAGLNIANNVDFFGLATYMQNPFKGIDSQVMVGPGIGIYAVNSEAFSIRAEGSVNYMWETYNPAAIADRSFLIGAAGAGLRLKLTDVADLSDDFMYLSPFNNASDWRLNNTVALTSSLSQHFALKVGYTFEHRDLPVAGRQANDRFTTAALVVKL